MMRRGVSRPTASVVAACRRAAAEEGLLARPLVAGFVSAARGGLPARAPREAGVPAPAIVSVAVGRRSVTDFGASNPLKMPALSPTMSSGTVCRWLVAEGDAVSAGDTVAEIETDKATVSYEVHDDGFMAKILVPGGSEDVPVGTVLALMVDDEGDLADVQSHDWSAVLAAGKAASGETSKAEEGSAHDGARANASSAASFGSKRTSPAAAHLVRTHGLDISALEGTGRHGVVTKGDVLVMMGKAPASALPRKAAGHAPASKTPPAAALSAAANAPSSTAAAPAAAEPPALATAVPLDQIVDLGGNLPPAVFDAPERPASAAPGAFEDAKPSTMRKVIAGRLTESMSTVPHSYAVMDCRIDNLLALRQRLKAVGVNVSVNDLVIKAVAKALVAVPEVNCRFDAESGTVKANDSVDISVAVATDGGLITPIVTHADTLGLAGINAAVKDLAARARKGKLAPHEYQGGSFSVSNLGMFGIDEFTAVINPPQACILAVGRGAQRAVLPADNAAVAADVDDLGDGPAPGVTPELATVMSVTMSSDRRVVDDAIAGQFLAAFRLHCETPDLLMA